MRQHGIKGGVGCADRTKCVTPSYALFSSRCVICCHYGSNCAAAHNLGFLERATGKKKCRCSMHILCILQQYPEKARIYAGFRGVKCAGLLPIVTQSAHASAACIYMRNILLVMPKKAAKKGCPQQDRLLPILLQTSFYFNYLI